MVKNLKIKSKKKVCDENSKSIYSKVVERD